jgi:hypothetical protein
MKDKVRTKILILEEKWEIGNVVSGKLNKIEETDEIDQIFSETVPKEIKEINKKIKEKQTIHDELESLKKKLESLKLD